MKKLIVVSLALLMLVSALATATPAAEKEEEQMTFRWSIGTAADHPASIITQEICDEIYEKTNGAVKIELYVANSLGGEDEVTDMIRAGAILGGTIGQQMFDPYWFDLGGLLLPFTWESPEAVTAFFWGYAKDNIWNGPIREATGITTLAGSQYGLRHLTTNGIEARSPADLTGKKIRSMTQPVSISYVTALGANAIPIAWAELYMALQTGTVQGQENPISNIISAKFYEVQDYVILTGHAGGMVVACVNDAVWNTIPEQYRTIIEAEFVAGSNRITEEVLSMEEEWIRELEERGMTVLRQEDIDYAAFRANALKVVADVFGDPKYDGWRELQKFAIDWVEKNL